MASPIESWNVTYTDADGKRQRTTGLADWDAAREEAARLRTTGARWIKTHPHFTTLQDTIAYANRDLIAQAQVNEDRAWKAMAAEREAAQERAAYAAEMAAEAEAASLFIAELDGETHATSEDAYWAYAAEADGRAEYDAEMAYERHLETNDQYRWEHEQDERRAAAFGYDYGTGGAEYYA